MSKARNFMASNISVTFGAANTEFAVTHELQNDVGAGITPKGFIITRRSGAGSVYLSTTPWTTSTAYLKTDLAALTASVLFFA